ncbi:MAG: PEP-CTERM sorting domain-containing protein [Nostoc sp.]|uniref:PEP-CTERM sorting domain-containing protein n=1 Tax=Nostoc sp. TaxID=1180 RepID=UPI002FFD019F
MSNLKNIVRGAALVSSTLALSTTVALSSAQAAVFGDVNITGSSTLLNGNVANPTIDEITFNSATVIAPSTGSFATLIGSNPIISAINLVQPSGNTYSGTTTNPFITFSNGLKFIADNPFTVQRVPIASNFTYAISNFSGNFIDATGQVEGQGLLTSNYDPNNGSYSLTLKTVAVPEPTATLGGFLALGLVALSTNNVAKNQKKLKVTA